MIRNSSSNPLFDFSGCMTSHLLKYPLPRQETVTHYHIFRHPLFEWLLLKIHIYIIKYYLCFKVNSFGIITHVFFALCLSVEQISKIVFSTILDSTNINWIFYFELTSANIKNFLLNAHDIISLRSNLALCVELTAMLKINCLSLLN